MLKLSEELRPVQHGVRLTPQMSDAVYHFAKARRISQYRFLGDVVSRAIALQNAIDANGACYPRLRQSSTLSYVLSEPPS